MCEAVEKYAEQRAEQRAEVVRMDNLLDSIKKLMINLKIGEEQAMELLEISEQDKEVLLKRL